jgi:hypothetical protein
MKILILQFSRTQINTINIQEHLYTLYPDFTIIRVFISLLYFDTFSIEVLFF